MRAAMEKLALLTGVIGRIALTLSGVGLVLMTVFVFAQVFSRYLLGHSLFWAEPASIILMGWFIFLGAAVGIREGYHLSFDVVLYFLPERACLWLYTLSDVIVGGFALAMVKYGWQLSMKTLHETISGLGVSGAFNYLPIVGGGALLALFCLERILRRLAGLPTARFGDDHDEADIEAHTGTAAETVGD